MERKWKLARNVALCLLCLAGLWWLKGQPLPMELAYKRAWKAHFLEERPRIWSDDRLILAKGRDALYLYQHSGERIHVFPLENDVGFALAATADLVCPLEILAYEGSGTAVRAELVYQVYHENSSFCHQAAVEQADGVFRFPVCVEPSGNSDDGRPFYDGAQIDAVTDIYEDYMGYSLWQDYVLTIRFYDETDHVVAELQKEGGTSYEGRKESGFRVYGTAGAQLIVGG